MNIWGRYQGRPPEKLDSDLTAKEAAAYVGEYRMAFGPGWVIWAGRKKDDPTKGDRGWEHSSYT